MDNAHRDTERDYRSSKEYDLLVESLRASEARYRELFENANDLLFTVDLEGRFTALNRAAEETTGFSRDELVGADISVLVPPEFVEKVRESMRHKIKTQEQTRYEIDILAKDGRYIPVEIGSRLTYVNDEPVIQGIARDISERKRAEVALREAKEAAEDASRAKSSFLANMSHEIRTPMNGIIGMTEILLNTTLTPEQREYQTIVQRSADALLNLLNDILDFSKIEAGKLDLEQIDFELRDTIADALHTIAVNASDKGIELACHVASDVPNDLIGDPSRFRQVIVNLAENGIKFTREGEVVVEVCVESRTDDSVRLQLAVRDTGVGIPRDKQEQVFESFSQADATTTRNYGGTGLGLTISMTLVRMMGGRIWVESEEGAGSTFRFTAEFGIGQPKEVTAIPESLQDVPVLVVDDNDTNRMIIQEMLFGWGMKPTLAAGAVQALEAMRRAVAQQRRFPLVITDAVMPAMDGFELAEEILADPELSSTQLLMLSSAGNSHELTRSRELGIARCLPKPVKQSSLLDAITRELGVTVDTDSLRAESSENTVSKRHLRLLLAEDGLVNQKVAVRFLEQMGHCVVVAENGREAVDLWEQNSFDAILMDVQMPELDGFEATAEIRRREEVKPHRTPIIAMTAHAMKGDRERCLNAGMDGYVSKPIRVTKLEEVLKKVVTQDWSCSSPDPSRESG